MQNDFRHHLWWDERVRQRKGDLKNLIFNDDYREQFWDNVDEFLKLFSFNSAADIGCGYGRFSKHFQDYVGLDFSGEMISLARKINPNKEFVQEACLRPIPKKVDIVFEVNCLHSFGISREEFINFYSQFARKAVICIERNGVTLEWVYEKTDRELSQGVK